MAEKRFPVEFGTIMPEISIKAAMVQHGFEPEHSEITTVIKALLERLKNYGHRYRVEYWADQVEDLILYQTYIDRAEYGFNIVLFDPGDAPLMICINFNGKIFGEHLGWINMEPDLEEK